ncbi:MAG: hypothetical protein JXR45_10560 [Deltaproteobacteria bacterium]|nr:hypothetical protein [Deltaproteobacteria bacterium]
MYLETGGRPLGQALGNSLGVPVFSLNIRYPLSRWMSRNPVAAPILWLVKEIMYKWTRPVLKSPVDLPHTLSVPLVLADDRVSSLRTVNAALKTLAARGVTRSQVIVVTQRAGHRAVAGVDYIVEIA